VDPVTWRRNCFSPVNKKYIDNPNMNYDSVVHNFITWLTVVGIGSFSLNVNFGSYICIHTTAYNPLCTDYIVWLEMSVSTLKCMSCTLQRKQCTLNKVILCIVTPNPTHFAEYLPLCNDVGTWGSPRCKASSLSPLHPHIRPVTPPQHPV